MTKLNDLQSILLSTAAQRDSGSLYPVPETVAGAGARLRKAIASLSKAGFAEEREAGDRDATCRTDGDLRFGMFITAAGGAAIGVGETSSDDAMAAALAPDQQPPRTSKTSALLALLQRDTGATMAELIEATGWLPHTTRAALTGLRKKGHAIQRGKRGDVTCYTLQAADAA